MSNLDLSLLVAAARPGGRRARLEGVDGGGADAAPVEQAAERKRDMDSFQESVRESQDKFFKRLGSTVPAKKTRARAREDEEDEDGGDDGDGGEVS